MRWLVRWRKKRRWWAVDWRHLTENASWWSTTVISADTPEEAAQKLLDLIDYKKHIKHYDEFLLCHVYKISEEFVPYKVRKSAIAIKEHDEQKKV